ncbi:MAG: hypothetical protein HYZ29_30780 [Myxococcales bacterium]|nr:hypothetical protein [Myxococcales bacterium]
MRVLSGLGVVALLTGVVLAACGGDDDGGGSSSTGGAGGGDAGGTGGGAGEAGDVIQPLAAVCVKSPAVAAPAGDASCPAKKPAVADALDDALGKAGIDRCGYGFSDATMAIWKPIFASDAYQLPSFRPLHQGLLRIPGFAQETEGYLDAALDGKETVSSVVLAASVRKGHAIDACAKLDGWESTLAEASPLAAALAKLGAGDVASLSAQTKGVPLDLQQALVPVLGTLAYAASEVRAAVATDVSDELDFLSRVYSFVIIPTEPFTVDKTTVEYLKKVDEKRIATAAALVARAVEAADLGKFAGTSSSPIAIDTPIGAVVIGGPSADSYLGGHLAEKSALFLELGGDDTYEVPVGAGRRDLPVGVAVDLGGKDHYGYSIVPDSLDTATRPPSDAAGRYGLGGAMGQTLSRVGRQGSGILGVGLLWDLGAEADVYASLALSQGAGAMGLGVLFDGGGADKYVAENTSQGSAMWGIGALIDVAGNDEYRTFYASQGFGYVHGVGVAVDGGGDDTWFADPGDPKVGGDSLYPSAQLPKEGNTSMCQGAGFGRRDDAKGLYMGGGHGVLYDRAGKDAYTASVFAQGSGYWLGFGLFTDKAGNDTYKGLWYVQGASAHFALGAHFDRAGDDVYNKDFPIRATSIGVGHDFSGALHVDLGGDDDYTAPGLSLGCGNSQGAGGLINLGGNDKYTPAGNNTYGCASLGHGGPYTSRDDMPTYGIFVDAEGTETYALPTGAPAAADGATWSLHVFESTTGAPKTEHSGGVDRAPGTVSLP